MPYRQARRVEQDAEKVYCATFVSLYAVNKADMSVETISKTTGLSDIGFNAIKHDPARNQLIIAYDNSNIDLWSPTKVTNIPDIKRKSIVGDKSIYAVDVHENFGYLSCGFGIVVVDLEKDEIKDTYYIGPNGDALKVNQTAVAFGKIFAGTVDGLYVADASTPTLSNFQAWERWDTAHQLPHLNAQYVLSTPNGLYAAFNDAIFRFDGEAWDTVRTAPGFALRALRFFNDRLYVCEDNGGLNWSRVVAIDEAGNEETISSSDFYNNVTDDIVVEPGGRHWQARMKRGLMVFDGDNENIIVPNGPASANAFNVDAQNGNAYVAAGAIISGGLAYNNDGFFVYENNEWKSFNRDSHTHLTDSLLDYASIAHNATTGKTYVGSYVGATGGGGLIEREGDNVNIYKQGYLLNMPAFETNYPVSDVSIDKDANVWMTNNGTVRPLHVLTPAGEWHSFQLPTVANTDGVMGVFPDNYGNIWINVKNTGLYVYNYGEEFESTADDQYKWFTAGVGQGNLPSNLVLDMVFDYNDEAWIGTDKGIAVVYCAANALDGCDAQQIIVSGTDSIAGYLLETERVNAIAVDPGNRKWVGTENGVWLLSADGLTEIHRFTVDNSPLFSNSILDIDVDGSTGLVYIATTRGLLAFQSDATDVNQSAERCEATVFPNPVNHEYTGPIAIRGVPYNATVRITDAAGGLVYQTTASGGSATWNGADYTGRRAASGVYYVTSVSADGQASCRAKLILVN